jgi:predicted nucleic acid-binding protein
MAEVLSGVGEGEEERILLLLDSYPCLEIRKNAADKAAELRRQQKWKLPDAFQASLCLLSDLRLATRNTRDFDPEKCDFLLLPYTL